MNGEEIECRQAGPNQDEISNIDKMNLTLLAGTPGYESLKKLMKMEVVLARDTALAISPAKREERNAAMDIAHAMALFCNYIQKKIEFAVIEHVGEVREAAAREIAKEQSFIESVLLNQ